MNLPVNIDFAELCRELRDKLKLTQKEMAKKLDVPLRTYESWEQREREPTGRNVIRILALRDVTATKKKPSTKPKK
ncbi:MAG: helix-turn-helix transcriptional regulator [Acidobacteriota bacterium]